LIVAAACFALVAPTLDWLQFHDPIENLNVATALEIRRGGRARSDAAGRAKAGQAAADRVGHRGGDPAGDGRSARLH